MAVAIFNANVVGALLSLEVCPNATVIAGTPNAVVCNEPAGHPPHPVYSYRATPPPIYAGTTAQWQAVCADSARNLVLGSTTPLAAVAAPSLLG